MIGPRESETPEKQPREFHERGLVEGGENPWPHMPPVRIATIGAALTANKGAASMLQAIIDRGQSELGATRIDVLTTYPDTDRRAVHSPIVNVVSATPRQILFPMFPLAVIAWLVRVFGGDPRVACRTPALQALAKADVVVDISGISFSDGRGIPILGYNILLPGIPLLLGRRVVKCAQALGPFRTWHNRLSARIVLSKLAAICARGPVTFEHLTELRLLTPTVEAADLAFLMLTDETDRKAAQKLVRGLTGYVVVSPSSVVARYCQRIGVDYSGMMAEFVSSLIDEGTGVVIIAHSYRPGGKPGRMNDGPLCIHIAERSGSRDVIVITGNESAAVLRSIIAGSRALVTSRFHAMISALATSTPVLVAGWSHKYHEVMSSFGVERFVIPYEQLNLEGIRAKYDELIEESAQVTTMIADALPAVDASAVRNFEVLRNVLRK